MLGFATISWQYVFQDSNTGAARLPPHNFQQRSATNSNHIASIAAQISDQAAVRHADAEHNQIGIFNGAPERRNLYGLTDKGKADTAELIALLAKWIERAQKPLFIVHSDFRRTSEMADILEKGLKGRLAGREERQELRERDPGLLEGVHYRDILKKFHITAREDESSETHASRGRLKRSLLELVLKSNVLTPPSRHILGLEPVRTVEERTTRLIKEFHQRQNQKPFLVLHIGHEFCLGPALNAFLERKAGMFWTNRHIPRAKPFMLSVNTALQHFIKEVSLPQLPQLEAA